MGLDMSFLKEKKENIKTKGNKVIEHNIDWDNEVGYLRKANQIHNWLVETIQDGNDNCGYYVFEKRHIYHLKLLIDIVLKESVLIKDKIKSGQVYNKENGEGEDVLVDGETIVNTKWAEKLLPTQSGFFFGNTEYNQWYIQDLKLTKDILENILETTDFEKEVIIYTSSW